ncbi:hypothetical protein HETIRDRAFT_460617 [Heterobasidion irregulare TC 32-1]|uniref:Uncharacterized protein n=1 Tax=Heterobasidion irregulare (strain TC 32-1) TaxID=747525 RepID=W4JV93_HETIT|nr:uncharacterized protein HETIRDRAFT_460617 [Heterobasidion irregulare TC 32-1]ETW77399.1 hypothetical protein HETIRDRAFT_460617 [Heterobasidion irregulare TC 32-1]
MSASFIPGTTAISASASTPASSSLSSPPPPSGTGTSEVTGSSVQTSTLLPARSGATRGALPASAAWAWTTTYVLPALLVFCFSRAGAARREGVSEKGEVRTQEEDATEWRGPGQGEGGEARSKLYGRADGRGGSFGYEQPAEATSLPSFLYKTFVSTTANSSHPGQPTKAHGAIPQAEAGVRLSSAYHTTRSRYRTSYT